MLNYLRTILFTLFFIGTLSSSHAQFWKAKQTRQVKPAYLDYPRETIKDISYTAITGQTLENVWIDVWGNEYIPIIFLQNPAKRDGASAVTFSLTEYTKELQREIEEERHAAHADEHEEEEEHFTPTPEEYDIWSNTSVNPYNVNLTNMQDTIRIDVSSYTSPGYKYVTSEFGRRRRRLHAGIDLKVYKGDTLRSAFADGVVRIRRFNRGGYGYYVVIRHKNGLETLYGHMSKIIVNEGDTLQAGDPIGLGGSTGRSSGSHLHFEMRYLGNPINPRDVVDFTNTHTVHNNTLVLTKENFKYFSKSSRGSKGRSGSAASSGSDKQYVTIRKGDTLGALARRHGTTVARLKQLNGLKNNNIRAGRKLRVR